MVKQDAKALLKQRPELIHSEDQKVRSHQQREQGEWVKHTLMLEGYEVPFTFKRKQAYRSLVGARVNLSYYPHTELVAGLEFETMKVVRIRRS